MAAPAWDVTVVPNLTDTWIEPSEPRDRESHLVQIYPASDSYALVRLPSGRLEIGRDPTCDIPIMDESASRRHAAIERTDEGYVALDIGSTNGVFVNDTRVQRCILSSGDRIRIGRHIFKFLNDDRFESKFHESVHALATRDGLTGAYNKRYFDDSLTREFARCTRREKPLSLLMIDLDHFKKINDTHGHVAGDEVLVELIRRARDIVRRDDVLARCGGEEFAVLLPETSLDQARSLAGRMREAIIGAPFSTSVGPIPVTASLGVAQADPASDPIALVEAADKLLYVAKTSGRNQVAG